MNKGGSSPFLSSVVYSSYYGACLSFFDFDRLG
jgi:hypothetical protein